MCSQYDNISSYMSIKLIEKLRSVFLKLTETNQVYVLGLVEGLKHAQGKPSCGKERITTQAYHPDIYLIKKN